MHLLLIICSIILYYVDAVYPISTYYDVLLVDTAPALELYEDSGPCMNPGVAWHSSRIPWDSASIEEAMGRLRCSVRVSRIVLALSTGENPVLVDRLVTNELDFGIDEDAMHVLASLLVDLGLTLGLIGVKSLSDPN